MRAALAVGSSVFGDMTQCSLVEAYLRFMLPPSQAQTKYFRLVWWSRIKDHYVLCGTIGYEGVLKEIIGAILSQISQFGVLKEIIGAILSQISQFTPSNASFILSSPLSLILRATFSLQCFLNHKIFVYVFRIFAVHTIFLGYRCFLILRGIAVINDVLW
jgi:hypothetical protein